MKDISRWIKSDLTEQNPGQVTMSGGSGSGDNLSWVSVSILALAMVGVVSNAACVAILAWKKRSSMFHRLLKVRK